MIRLLKRLIALMVRHGERHAERQTEHPAPRPSRSKCWAELEDAGRSSRMLVDSFYGIFRVFSGCF